MYLGVGLRLIAVAVSDPSAPRALVQSDPLSGVVNSVVLAGDYAFVLTDASELSVFNLSHPDRLLVVSSLKLAQPAYGLAISDGYAYVAGGEAGLVIIDVSTPETLRLVQRFQTRGQAMGVTVAGNFAYVTEEKQFEGSTVLDVIDLTDPTAPRLTGSLELATPHALAVAVAGDYAFVATRGLRSIDISDPFHPRPVGFFEADVVMDDVAVAGSYALISSNLYCDVVAVCPRVMRVVDISNPVKLRALETPSLQGDLVGAGRVMAVQDGLVYMATEVGLQLLDASSWKLVGEYQTASRVADVAVANGVVYGGDGDRAFHVFDVHHPNAPELVSTLSEGIGAPNQIHVVADYAILGLWNTGFAVVNVRQAQQPRLLAKVEELGSGPLAVRGESVYLIHPSAGGVTGSRLSTYDIGDPATPRPVSSLQIPGGDYTWLALADHYALLGTYALMEIVDIADVGSPRKVGEVALDPPEQAHYPAIAAEERHVFLLRQSAVKPFLADLLVYEFAPPAALRPMAALTLSRGGSGLTVAGNYVYVVGANGLSVVDISDPVQPREVGVSDFGGMEIVAEGDYLYIAGGSAGLLILRVSAIAPGGS